MNKPNVHPMPFPMDLVGAARKQALEATVEAMGVNCQKGPAWTLLMEYNVARIEASLRKAIVE